MVFKSDRQRKAVMAKLTGGTRAETRPTILERIRRKVRPTPEEREITGKERIKREKEALEKEKITAERLRQELEVEQARESVAEQRRETESEFAKLERERFARTPRGRAVALARRGVAVGIKRLKEAQARKPKRRRKAPKKEEPGFFGI